MEKSISNKNDAVDLFSNTFYKQNYPQIKLAVTSDVTYRIYCLASRGQGVGVISGADPCPTLGG